MKLAFVHIEKTAGTTFIHLLRQNFFLRYVDVRPVTSCRSDIFKSEDLRVYQRLNPWLTAIGGHAVVPWSNLEETWRDVQYITLLRNPTRRVISHYLHWVDRRGYAEGFDAFVHRDDMRNLQVRKIAPDGRWKTAAEILEQKFLLTGLVEQFDEFLLLLAEKLMPTMAFDIDYKPQNKGAGKAVSQELLAKYDDHVRAANEDDWNLYDYVRDKILPRARAERNEGLDHALDVSSESNRKSRANARLYADYVVRKAYYQPVTGRIRLSKGMPAHGSYRTY